MRSCCPPDRAVGLAPELAPELAPQLALVLGLFAALVLVGCGAPEGFRVDSPEEAAVLRRELLTMAAADQTLRDKVTDGTLTEEEAEQGVIDDAARTARIKRIVATHGWPTADRVGVDGVKATFILVQHADSEPEFQAWCLPRLRAAAERGEISKVAVAYLTDRVRVKEGRPQVYGTQYEGYQAKPGANFSYRLPVVEDAANLDARRAEMGLPPWIEYEQRMAKLHGREPATQPLAAE